MRGSVHSGRSKERHSRSRDRPTKVFRVCKVNLATLKVATSLRNVNESWCEMCLWNGGRGPFVKRIHPWQFWNKRWAGPRHGVTTTPSACPQQDGWRRHWFCQDQTALRVAVPTAPRAGGASLYLLRPRRCLSTTLSKITAARAQAVGHFPSTPLGGRNARAARASSRSDATKFGSR